MPSLTLFAAYCDYEDKNGLSTHFAFESLAKPIEAWLIIQRMGANHLPDRVVLHVAHLIFGDMNVQPGRITTSRISIDFDDLFRAMRSIKASEKFVSYVPIVGVVGCHNGALRNLEVRTFDKKPEVFHFNVDNIRHIVDADNPELTTRSAIHGDYCAVCAHKQCGCPVADRSGGDLDAVVRSASCQEDHYEVNKIERFDTLGCPTSKVQLSRYYVDSCGEHQETSKIGMVFRTIELSHLRILLSDYSTVNDFGQFVGVPWEADYEDLDKLYRGSLPPIDGVPALNANNKGQNSVAEAPRCPRKPRRPRKPPAPKEAEAPKSPTEPKDPKKVVIAVKSEGAPIVTIEINGVRPGELEQLAGYVHCGTNEFKPIGDSFIKVEDHVTTVLGKSMVAKHFRTDAFQKSFGKLYPEMDRIADLARLLKSK